MRAVFAAIAVVVLVGAFVILRPSGNNSDKPATAAPAADSGPLLTGGKVTKIHVAKGDTVRFRVVSPKAEEVHVHGYDLKKELSPNKVATMSFKATIDGIFDIEFESSSTQIGQLTVDP
jgi:hypothetical protein